ncbi:hypothetical protein AX14_002298, partial [Amanita brunnescens Koide BX004]
GSRDDFICLLIRLAKSWNDDAQCQPANILKTIVNDASALVKAEEELAIAQSHLSRIRNERNQALTDVKKLSETANRLRKDRNHLKAALEDIAAGGTLPTHKEYEALQEELAHLCDEQSRLNKVVEHDKEALHTAAC